MTSPARALPAWLRPLAEVLPTVTAADLPWRADRRGDQRGDPARNRAAAVLVLLASGADGPDVLLTERAGTLRQHSGQGAFPGGRAEPADSAPAATALREAAEETGLDPAGVDVLGELPAVLLAHSRHAVTPVVAHWHTPCPVAPVDPAEVARVERVALTELADPGNQRTVHSPSGYRGPAFAVRGLLVWGFTAEVLLRVLELGGLSPLAPGAAAGAELSLDEALRWAERS